MTDKNPRTPPNEIYLQWHNSSSTYGVTWSTEQENDDDVLYTRPPWLWFEPETAPLNTKILMTLRDPDWVDYLEPPFVVIGWVNVHPVGTISTTGNQQRPLSWLVAWAILPEPYSP